MTAETFATTIRTALGSVAGAGRLGPAHRLRPSSTIDGAPMRCTTPARRRGTDPAACA